MAPSSVGSSPIRHPNILAYPLCLIHSRKGNRLHVGSIPSASTNRIVINNSGIWNTKGSQRR